MEITVTVTKPATSFTTTDEILVEAFFALWSEFMKSETKPLRDATEVATEEGAMMQAMMQAVDFEIDKLLAKRVAANNRNVPLLQLSDVDRIVNSLVDDATPSEDRGVLTGIFASVTKIGIKLTREFLGAFDADFYTAFWKFTSAIMNEATSSGQTLKQVVVSPASRANVYRACMNYTTWRKLTAVRSAVVAGVSLSTLFGGAANFMSDEEAVALEADLTALDKELEAVMTDTAKQFKQFYVKLGQTIWPAGTRS